ncbi:solute carrier organic anion transporter family member 1C1-like [Latimeria chalumnae]|uniref:solute carrier organic anion transporter family member 1C1-like n=1 Tax=Latimeria chalumnae TaxID=7897 RepID=UPI00313AEB3D
MENTSKVNSVLPSKSVLPHNKETMSKLEKLTPKKKSSCFDSLKMFIVALSFAYFAKALSGSYMKSTITQIERRFDIPSSLAGIIDGSFEIGNLLVIIFVSYFGAQLHRPKIIGTGCLLMSIGTFLIAMPHFFMDRYRYETSVPLSDNGTASATSCMYCILLSLSCSKPFVDTGCEKEAGSSMWIYVFLGNTLQGIGETPVQPLGISYIDDFAREENVALYIGCVQTMGIIGPIFDFLLGALCAKLFVDIGFINLDSVTVTPKDARWVGAWWLGYFIAGVITLLAAIPFWFIPKALPENSKVSTHQNRIITHCILPPL